MPTSCAAYGCTEKLSKTHNPSVTFHIFPKDEKLREEWVRATRRKDFIPTKHTRLCSKHFRDQDIDRTSLSCVRIRSGAVPSIFQAFPKYLQKNITKRKSPKKRDVPTINAQLTVQPCSSDDLAPFIETSVVTREKGLKRKLSDTQCKLDEARKKVKLLQQSKRRLLKKNAKLKYVISDLKRKFSISTESLNVLESCSNGIGDLLQRQVAKHNSQPVKPTYSPELRSFALTLHFYSPHAYRYVRKVFDTCLPHPRTIQKWYQGIDGKPGFTEPAFSALKVKAVAASDMGKPLLCALIMDEMAIRQQLHWDGKKNHGYIDMGTQLDDDDSLPLAREALAFIVVAVNGSWKLPVGYFFIAGLGGTEKGNLVKQCLTKLHSVGVRVISLTFDGASVNMSMIKYLGCSVDHENINSTFPHPVTEEQVCVFLDPCHMLKLVRNTFGDKKTFVDGQNNSINWVYLEQLHKMQQKEGLNLANKLRAAHMAWIKKKMNVNLAAQLLSESVAKSLQFCLNEELSEFKGCEATIDFIILFNALFDILNSRNLCSSGYKRPLQNKNTDEIIKFLKKAEMYIRELKFPDGLELLKSKWKTGFIGFIICIRSLMILCENLLECSVPPLKFLLTFKMSQDHIELFFGQIRSMGGCNNNPTCKQFSAAYKKIMVHNDMKDVLRGNCLPLESVSILTVSSNYVNNLNSDTPSVKAINATSWKNRVLDDEHETSITDNDSDNDDDYACIPSSPHLTYCSINIVAYIAGFVVFKLKKSLHCEVCISALRGSEDSMLHSLIKLKTKGGLEYPSRDVIDVCISCEKIFREHMSCSKGSDLKICNIDFHKLVSWVLKNYDKRDIFPSLHEHMFDTHPLDNHLFLLIKAIAEKYLQVRYSYASNQYTAMLQAKNKLKSRQTYTKLIHFSVSGFI